MSTVSVMQRTIDALEQQVCALKKTSNGLREALGWFADEGHYSDTYRRGAGFVSALGLNKAREALGLCTWCGQPGHEEGACPERLAIVASLGADEQKP